MKANKNVRIDETVLYSNVGRRIRDVREEKGLTQQALASLVSLSRTSITNIEQGRQNIALSTFVVLADALNVPPKNLLPDRLPSKKESLKDSLKSYGKRERSWINEFITNG